MSKFTKRLVLILCVFVVLGMVGCGANSSEAYLGDWKIDSKVQDAPMGDYADGDLEKIIGAKLSFSADKASCFGDSMDTLGQNVDKPEYTSISLSKSDFESTMGMTFDAIGKSGDNITQITVVKDQDRNTGVVFYIIDDNTILLNSVGTFFIAKKS